MPQLKPPRGPVHFIEGHPLGPAGGLIFFPLFNEGSGGQVFDLSGKGNTGILTGTAPSWTAGKFGSAVALPGTNEYISVANKPSIQIFNAITAVLFYTSSDTLNMAFLEKGYKDLYLMRLNSTTVRMYYDQLTSVTVDVTIGSEVCDGLPHMIIFWWDGVRSKIFFDGVEFDGEATTGTIDTGGDVLGFGRISAIGWYSDMVIDCAMIYKRGLSPNEIAQLYREPFCMVERKISPAYFSVPTGGVTYQELNLIVSADASANETDAHVMVDTGKAVQADAAATEFDTQQMVETGKAVEAAASVSCTDLKVVFELNLEVTASGSVAGTDAHTMIETGKIVKAIATPAVIDTQAMVETGLGVSAEGSVSCTDTMGLLAHIAAFMILRQCT